MGWLAIVRHGEAGPGSPDAERRLTLLGEREAKGAGAWLASRSELAGARVWASPYRRAHQTAKAIVDALASEARSGAGSAELEAAEIETVEGVTPEDNVAELIERLARLDVSRPLIIVSHMPLVGLLTGRLVEGSASAGLAFPTAGVALLEAEVWAGGCATLKTFVSPPH